MTTRLERVKRLAELNYSNAEIAAELGLRSDRQVIRLKRQAGIPAKNATGLPQEVRDRIRYLSEVEGWPLEEIRDTLGVSYEAAYRWSVRGPGDEWRTIAAQISRKHRALWNELRNKR